MCAYKIELIENYSCRCCLCFLLQASRGSHCRGTGIAHNSLQLCCVDKHIDHESEERKTSLPAELTLTTKLQTNDLVSCNSLLSFFVGYSKKGKKQST